MKSLFLSLSFVFLFTACSSDEIHIEKDCVIFSQFPREIAIKSTSVLELKNKTGGFLLCDSFLILQNTPDSSDYLFSFFDLQGLKKIEDKVKFGGDIAEVMSPLSCGIFEDSILWAHDISADRIVSVNLGKNLLTNNPTYRQYDILKFYYSVDFLDTNRIIASGDFSSINELQEVDLKLKKVTNQFGEYKNIPKVMSEIEWKSGHESFLYNKPTHDKAVLAARYTDQIELFDLITRKRIKIIKGPENIPLSFSYITNGGGHGIARTDKTKFCFVSGSVTDSYIFLLFSGNKNQNPLLNNGRDVFVYDWYGSPVCRLKLDRYVNSIAVTKDGRDLYAFDKINRKIVKTSFKL